LCFTKGEGGEGREEKINEYEVERNFTSQFEDTILMKFLQESFPLLFSRPFKLLCRGVSKISWVKRNYPIICLSFFSLFYLFMLLPFHGA
jgi:hypothetical protein